MKRTKIISTVASFALMASMITGITANAIVDVSSTLEDRYADCIKLDEDDFVTLGQENPLEHFYAQYFKSFEDNKCVVYRVEKNDYHINIEVCSEADFNELKNVIKNVNENYIIEKFDPEPNGEITFNVRIENGNGNFNELSTAEVKRIYEIAKDKIKFISYNGGYYNYSSCYFDDVLQFDYFISEEEIEAVKNFVEQNSIDVEMVEYISERNNPGIKLIPNTDITAYERFQLSKAITKETGVTPLGVIPSDMQIFAHNSMVNLTNYTNGDTNEDGDLTIADSVAVLQFIGNPDKYALSTQAEFNADVDGIDGITGADAFVIQQMELGIK